MIGDMPVIKGEVHQEKAERELEGRWQRHKMDHAKSLHIRPMQRRLCCRSHQQRGDKKCQGRNRKIHQQTSDQRTRALSEREQPLQHEQQDENPDDDQRSRKRLHISSKIDILLCKSDVILLRSTSNHK